MLQQLKFSGTMLKKEKERVENSEAHAKQLRCLALEQFESREDAKNNMFQGLSITLSLVVSHNY